MQDEGKRQSRLQFSKEEQVAEAALEPVKKPGEKYSRSKNPLVASRLQLTDIERNEPKLEKRSRKAEKAVERASEKLDKAKARIPKQKAMAIARATDEATGKSTVRLLFEEKAKPPSKLLHEGFALPTGEAHRQISAAEDENVGVEAAHGLEKGGEASVRHVAHSSRMKKLKAYRATERAERQLDKATIRLMEKKAPLSSNPFSRWQQKRSIRENYKAVKAAGGATKAQSAAKGTATFAQRTTQGVKKLFTRNKKSYVMGGLLFLMLAMVMNGLNSCTTLFNTGMQAIVIATYPAEDTDILAAEWMYREMEMKLQNDLNNYFYDHPEYDEYEFDLDEIWHDPHVLISLISARIGREWKIDDVYGTLDILFEKQYTLTETVRSETRYRQEWVTHHEKIIDPITGEVTWRPYDVLEDVPYTYRTVTVTLKNFNLSHLPFYVLSREAVGMYAMYISVHGNRDDLFWGNPHAAPLKDYTRHDIPEEYLQDETFARIIEEAEKYLGYPYVWGGDSPETSFDCSGFVSYVFTNSGVRNVGRLGATSLYGACQKISPAQAKPGDLIFFEGTIPGDEGITHVGIYVGDDWMIHCGSPLGYAYLNDAYHQEHFYGFGRLI